MGKLSWIDDEKQIIDGKISVGARVDIKYLQYNKHRVINEVRWRAYQELCKNLGEHPNMEGCFYVRSWIDLDPNTQNVYALCKIESIHINSSVVKAVITKPEYTTDKKLSFKDRLKILFKGEL